MSSNSLKFTAGRWLFFFWFQKCHFFFFLFFLWIFKIWCQAGPGSKFSNLQQVGDFSIFGSFFWGVEGHKIWVLLGGFNCADWTVHLRDWATTMSLRGPATQHLHNERAKRASLMGRDGRTGRTDGTGRSSKVSFKILHTLWVYRFGIYLLI